MNSLKPYLPLVIRVGATLAAGLGPVVAALIAKQPVTDATLTACAVAAGAAWKRWHPSASLDGAKAGGQ